MLYDLLDFFARIAPVLGVTDGFASVSTDLMVGNNSFVLLANQELISFCFDPNLGAFAFISARGNGVTVAFISDQVVFANMINLIFQERKRYRMQGLEIGLKKQKILTWTKNHYLSAVEVQDETGTILHKKTYDYDTFGNPILEILHDHDKTYTITREYSKDGRNLLLKEKTEEGTKGVGAVETYTYPQENKELDFSALNRLENQILQSGAEYQKSVQGMTEEEESPEAVQGNFEEETEFSTASY